MAASIQNTLRYDIERKTRILLRTLPSTGYKGLKQNLMGGKQT